MRIRTLSLALLFAGSTAVIGMSRITPTVAAVPTANTVLAEDHADDPYLQHLRETRRLLNSAKDEFDKDPADRLGHRKQILEHLDKAIDDINVEVKQYVDHLDGK